MRKIHVVAAIIWRAGEDGKTRVLAAKRGGGEFKGGWEFPGGKIEDGESQEQALEREIWEELSAEIRMEKKICSVEHRYPAFSLTMECFWARLRTDKIEPREHDELRWLSEDELDGVGWLPADKKIIGRVREAMRGACVRTARGLR